MSLRVWTLILGLAVLAIGSSTGRALHGASATSEDDGGEVESVLSNNIETSSTSGNQWEAEEWVKVSLAPESRIEHKLGSPLELECEILGTPPPQVKWVSGSYNSADEVSSNAISVVKYGGVARVRVRLFLDHIPSVGDRRYTCIGQVGGQVVHATTTVKTTSSDIFPASGSIHHRGIPAVELLNHYGMGSPAGPVAPRITHWYNVLLEKIGSPIVLPCEAYAQPHPQVYWMDNNNNMISNHDPRLRVMPNGSLMITSLKWDDMGEFHCVAKNDIGKDRKGTFLYPMAVSSEVNEMQWNLNLIGCFFFTERLSEGKEWWNGPTKRYICRRAEHRP